MIDIQKIVWKAARSENSRLLGCGVDDLERFAALYREALIAELVAGSGEPKFHEDYGPHGNHFSYYTADQLAGAVLRERERCANLVADLSDMRVPASEYAAAIRSGK